ncbi:MAG: hypothetical protein IJ881_00245 [Neisseriaceae bacterium]|nr:hypothetical protein [Neisseriaceae bacterium]
MESGNWLLYIIFGSLSIAWVVAVWRMSGVWSIILPAVTSVSYLLQLGCAYFDWYSLANFFWYLILFLGVVCFLVFFAPIFNGLAPSSRAVAKQEKKNAEYQRNAWFAQQQRERQMRFINGK